MKIIQLSLCVGLALCVVASAGGPGGGGGRGGGGGGRGGGGGGGGYHGGGGGGYHGGNSYYGNGGYYRNNSWNHNDWTAAGAVLTGVAIGGVLGSLMNQPETVIVQQPVYAAPAAYYAPASVAVAPGPGYYVEAAPGAPVYVQPAPVYVQPAPVYYYAPRPVYQVRYW